eukprot:4232808-Prymnesium_polylepis.2
MAEYATSITSTKSTRWAVGINVYVMTPTNGHSFHPALSSCQNCLVYCVATSTSGRPASHPRTK